MNTQTREAMQKAMAILTREQAEFQGKIDAVNQHIIALRATLQSPGRDWSKRRRNDFLLPKIQTALMESGHPMRSADVVCHLQEQGIEWNGESRVINQYLWYMADSALWDVRKIKRGLYVYHPREEPVKTESTPNPVAGNPS